MTTYQDPPRREVIPPHPHHAIRALTHDFPSPSCGWGAHPEYEIHLITKTYGSFIAGDHVGSFAPGQVSLMGPNLPHDWVSDLEPGEVARDRDAVIHFSHEWISDCVKIIPELDEVTGVLDESSRGLVFSGPTGWQAAEIIMEVVRSTGTAQIAHFLRLLATFARAPAEDREAVASPWLARPRDGAMVSAVDAGISYILDNLTDQVRLSTAARLAFMSEPTFSKYFKSASGLTFSAMVKKLRVAHARRLLDTTDLPISRVAEQSGYRNMANFNRQFLAETGATPSEYRRMESSLKPPPEVLSLGLKGGREPSDHGDRPSRQSPGTGPTST